MRRGASDLLLGILGALLLGAGAFVTLVFEAMSQGGRSADAPAWGFWAWISLAFALGAAACLAIGIRSYLWRDQGDAAPLPHYEN